MPICIGVSVFAKCREAHLLLVCSENAEIIGQHLTLPRWIQILSARIKGLKSVSQDNGTKAHTTQGFHCH